MELSIQSSLINVKDLDRSIDFYRKVLDLRVISQRDQVAALMISDRVRRQVLILRESGSRTPTHAGGGSVGLRLLALETGSLDDLDGIEDRLVERQAFLTRHRTRTWEAISGLDPDRIEISIAASVTGEAIQSEDWDDLDGMVYRVGA